MAKARLDINLLPKKKKLSAKVALGVPAVILLIAALAAGGVMLPDRLLQTKEERLASLQQQLAAFSATEQEYLAKLQEFTILQKQQANYESFTGSSKQTLDLLKRIKAAKPAAVTILAEEFDSEKIVLAGFAETDLAIADFEVSLRKLGLFSDITLSSITGAQGRRSFSFTLTHKPEISSDAASDSSSGAASSQEGGVG